MRAKEDLFHGQLRREIRHTTDAFEHGNFKPHLTRGGKAEQRFAAQRAEAIQEDELAASATGIRPTNYKVLAFTMGAVLAAVTGVIASHFLNTWNARQGTFDSATVMLACVVIGGSRTFIGPVVGGFVLTAIPELLRGLSDAVNGTPALSSAIKDGRPFVYGLLMVIVCIYFPRGLVSPKLLERFVPRRLRVANTAVGAGGPSAPATVEDATQ